MVDHEGGATLVQTGARYLDPAPLRWPHPTDIDGPTIDTFVVEAAGGLVPAGVDDDLAEVWLPAVSVFATAITTALEEAGVATDGDAYVTASKTPGPEVASHAHVDDDLFVADDGVGVVAIAGQWGGPRVATEGVPCEPVRAPAPVALPDDVGARFDAGAFGLQATAADRIVVFPQFGQLHAGPILEPAPAEGRHLLVYRARTVAQPTR